MPLRLKSLELHGYKTFAAKTDFEFAEGITAIVGPNGSGKSNIADALRWVLGEQSYSLLRGKKTEDMIFSGSEQRPRAGMASASIIFDNSNNWLPVDFSEVGLARRAYRDGRNDYLLNNQHVRLKDINELLAQSGLSERTYTILGQGLVDASLALKADERRRLFEEAAGIGLYRSWREEALRRLETTQRNLDRVLDIMSELEPRLKSLERQAIRAQEYAQVQADLRVLLHEWYGFHWHRAQRELIEAMELARQQETKLKDERERYQEIRLEFLSFRDHLNSLRARLNSWHRQSARFHEERESVSGELAVIEERQRSMLDSRQAAMNEQTKLNEEIKLALERFNESEADMAKTQAEFEEARLQIGTAQDALEKKLNEKARLETELKVAREEVDRLATVRSLTLARQEEMKARVDIQKQKLTTHSDTIKEAEVETQVTLQKLEQASNTAQKLESVLKKANTEILSTQSRLDDLEQQVKQKEAERVTRQAEQIRHRTQLAVLEEAEQSLAGYADGAKILLTAVRQSKLDGAQGALSAAIEVPAELEVAISAALGEYAESILLSSGNEAEKALSLLDSDQTGRASILPLDWLSPAEPIKIQASANHIGIASELVKVPAELRPAVDLLLGQVLVVRERKDARQALSGLSGSARVVTLRGEVFHATGQVLAGRPAKAAAIGRPRQRRELQEQLGNIDHQISLLDTELVKVGEIGGNNQRGFR